MKRILFLLAFVWSTFGASGDITAVSVDTDGKGALISITGPGTGGAYTFKMTTNSLAVIGGTNNSFYPSINTPYFTVTYIGHDTSGNVLTNSRTVWAVAPMRKPYPNQTTEDETAIVSPAGVTVHVVLSDVIYGVEQTNLVFTDPQGGFYTQGGIPNNAVTSLAVTDNSTVTYPKVIGDFVIEDRRPVNGTQTIEMNFNHKYAVHGKPVARVSVTATGGTSGHTESGSTSSMSPTIRGDGRMVYAVTLNLSTAAGFTRGELVTINLTAYPWIGDSGAVLDSTVDAGSRIWQLNPLHWTIMDTMIAVVDPTNGVNATGWAALSQSSANAHPFLTKTAALTAIAATNNQFYGLNRIDGGDVQLMPAPNWDMGKYGAQAMVNGYFTIEPHSSTDYTGVIFTTWSVSQSQYSFQRYKNITIQRPGNTYIMFSADNNVAVMEGVHYTDTATSWYSGANNSNIEFLDCTTGNSYMSPGGNGGHCRLIRNCAYPSVVGNQSPLGNAQNVFGASGTGGGSSAALWVPTAFAPSILFTNCTIQFVRWDGMGDKFIPALGHCITNMAIVGNSIESVNLTAQPIMEFSSQWYNNILIIHNTFAGQRFNHENDWATPFNYSASDFVCLYNVMTRGSHRADIRAANGAIIGYWSIDNSVGWIGNWCQQISSGGDMDFWAFGSNSPINNQSLTVPEPAGFVNDKSQEGVGGGGGDYRIKSGSSMFYNLPNSGGNWMIPKDINGNWLSAISPPGTYNSGQAKYGGGFF